MFLFLLCAAMWAGSPIQDLVISTHGRFIDHPTHELTDKQIESLNVLIKHHAVIPAEKLIEQIVNFYTNMINLLVALLAILGVVAYMYVRISSREVVLRQTEDYMESRRFLDLLNDSIDHNVKGSIDIHISDNLERFDELEINNYLERFDELENRLDDLGQRYFFLERQFSEIDDEETEGNDLTLSRVRE